MSTDKERIRRTLNDLKHEELTSQVIKSYYHVYNSLGLGFLERVYQNSLAHVLSKLNMRMKVEAPISIYFEGALVGEYKADLIVNDLVIIEVKAIEQLVARHEAQLVNYLKATSVEVGLLMNFGSIEPDFRRRVLSNSRRFNQKNP